MLSDTLSETDVSLVILGVVGKGDGLFLPLSHVFFPSRFQFCDAGKESGWILQLTEFLFRSLLGKGSCSAWSLLSVGDGLKL